MSYIIRIASSLRREENDLIAYGYTAVISNNWLGALTAVERTSFWDELNAGELEDRHSSDQKCVENIIGFVLNPLRVGIVLPADVSGKQCDTSTQ